MNYDLVCYGTFKENNIRCFECPDKYKCYFKAYNEDLKKKEEKEYKENEL